MAVEALDEQSLGGSPGLGWFAVPGLVGDDLVQGEMEAWIDDRVVSIDILVPPEGARELRMFVFDEDRAFVRIRRIEQGQVDPVELASSWRRRLGAACALLPRANLPMSATSGRR